MLGGRGPGQGHAQEWVLGPTGVRVIGPVGLFMQRWECSGCLAGAPKVGGMYMPGGF